MAVLRAGNYTTLIALFSLEPSENQLTTVERMHKDFELANRTAWKRAGSIPAARLSVPLFVRRQSPGRGGYREVRRNIRNGASDCDARPRIAVRR